MPRNPTISIRAILSRSGARCAAGRGSDGAVRDRRGRGGRRRAGVGANGWTRARVEGGERQSATPASPRRGGMCGARSGPVMSTSATGTSGRRRHEVDAPELLAWSRRAPRPMRAVMPTHSGSFRAFGAPGGERNGESVSTSRRSAGTSGTTSAVDSSPRAEGEAGDRDGQAEVEHPAGVVDRARRTNGSRPAAGPARTRRADACAAEPGRAKLVERSRPGRRSGRPPIGRGGSPACPSRAPTRGSAAGSRAGPGSARRRGRSRGRSRRSPRPARPAASAAISRQPAVVDLRGVVGMDADRGVEPVERGRPAPARGGTRRRSSPGTRIRSRPAARARSRTAASSPANRSALRWQWQSISRTLRWYATRPPNSVSGA